MSDVARDDLALDALAAGHLPDSDDEVFGLLGALRADLEPPAPVIHAEATRVVPPVVVPLRRKRRPFALVALSAAAGLVLGGLATGAVVTSDQPGEVFYAARKAVLGDPEQAERVTKLLDDAAEALAEGDRREARKRLEQARERLAGVEDGAEREALTARLDRLAAIAAAPAPRPSATPSRDDDETPEPRETESPVDDSSGSDDGSDNSGSGSDDPDDTDNSGSGSSGSGSGSSGSGGDDGD